MSNEQLDRHPMELTTQEGKNLIDQIDDLKPDSADSVRNQPFAEVYRESPLFRAFHNSEMLEGKCDACEFKQVCRGSRACAYALMGNPLGEEPCFSYVPKGYAPPPQIVRKASTLNVLQGA